ncbi:MAG: helix-turn-helix domain-containing protein [Spartobacteria bacterium]|nr:helix-turn-helix domain-containing protein [Spartobacteria bacterium]
MAKQYNSIVEMLQAMDLPPDQKKRQVEYLQARQLSRLLTVMRAQMQMSQELAAEKLGWSQGRVSKLETKTDRDISIGDLMDYSGALGMQMSILFLPNKFSIAERIKVLACEIVRLLQKLVRLSKGDEAMERGVERFHEKFLKDLNRMVGDSQKSIRTKPKSDLTVIGPPQIEQMLAKKDCDLVPVG